MLNFEECEILINKIEVLQEDIKYFNDMVEKKLVENKYLEDIKKDIKECRFYLNKLSNRVNNTVIIK